jgi:TatA/E family protein of Tat protein translocase
MLVLALVLVLFGGKKLPEFARGMGKALREFQRAKAGVQEEFKRALEPEPPPNLPPLAAPNLDATPADLSPTLPPPRPTPADGATPSTADTNQAEAPGRRSAN